MVGRARFWRMASPILPQSKTSGHNSLRGRSDPNCHPMSSITGLREALEAIAIGGGAPVGVATPSPVATTGTGSAGTAIAASREDHQHVVPVATADDMGVVRFAPGSAMPWVDGQPSIAEIAADMQAHVDETYEAHGGLAQRTGGSDADVVAVWSSPVGVGGRASFTATDELVTVPSLLATDQAGTGERLVIAQADGHQRAEDDLRLDPGPPNVVPWIGFWDMEGSGGNLTTGAGGAFTAAVPGYGAYALAPWDTTTPLVGAQSALIPASGLYGRYATWTPSAFGDVTFGGVFGDGSVLNIGPANADDGVAPAFRAGAHSATSSNFQVRTASVSMAAIPALAGGPAHIMWRYTASSRLVERFVNGSFFDSYTVPAGTDPTTIGCIGSFHNGAHYDQIAIVAGLLTNQQIADLAAGVAWNLITPTYSGAGRALEIGPSVGLRVLDHAGTGQRMLSAQADGTHTPVAQVTWTGAALAIAGAMLATTAVIGTDPGGSETVRIGGTIRATGLITSQGVTIGGTYIVNQSSDSQVLFMSMRKQSAAAVPQFTANFHATGTGSAWFLQFLDSAGAFYTNPLWYDYTNKRWGMGSIIAPETSLHVSGTIMSSGTAAGGRALKSCYNVVAGGATSSDAIQIEGRNGGSGGFVGTITTGVLSASRTYTMPDASIIVAGSAAALTSGRIPYATTGGVLTDSAYIMAVAGRSISLGGAGNPGVLNLNGDAGSGRTITFTTGGLNRWVMFATGSAESGSNAGSGFRLDAYADNGSTLIDTPISITRAAGGAIALSRPVTIGTDPGGSETMRVGGSFRFTGASVIDGSIASLTVNSSLFTSLPFNLTGSATLASAQADAYACGMRLVPTYTGAFPVTRHNYVVYANVATSGGATVTDACVARYDAAAGTHKAVDAGTTKATPSIVDAWEKVNLNGVVFYRPLYANKTT